MRQNAFIFMFILVAFCAHAMDSKNRVEDLFIWKVSDEMKLSVSEEKKFSEMLRGINGRRMRANESLQDVLRRLSLSQSTKEKEKLLSEQKRLLRAYNELSLEEADEVQKLFGVDRAAQYFVIKNDLTNRLKSFLASPEKATAPAPKSRKLGPPQVIEER